MVGTADLTMCRVLVGLVGIERFWCVGDIYESRLALQWLVDGPEWKDARLVAALGAEIEHVSEQQVESMLSFQDTHLIPARFLPALSSMRP